MQKFIRLSVLPRHYKTGRAPRPLQILPADGGHEHPFRECGHLLQRESENYCSPLGAPALLLLVLFVRRLGRRRRRTDNEPARRDQDETLNSGDAAKLQAPLIDVECQERIINEQQHLLLLRHSWKDWPKQGLQLRGASQPIYRLARYGQIYLQNRGLSCLH